MNHLEGIKVGDRVWAWGQGWGVICKLGSIDLYPISVKFDDGVRDDFTKDGVRFRNDKIPSLFWDEIIVTYPPRPVPAVPWDKVPVDTKVMVDFTSNGTFHPRHYAGNPNTYFIDGQTSFTTVHADTCKSMKLAEPVTIDGVTYPEGSE